VGGDPGVEGFLAVGRRAVADLEAALQSVGREWSTFGDVLDFGCGCGRVLRWLEGRAPACRFHGCDIDAEAIGWCQREIAFARFARNDPRPPLPWGDESFDLVYSVSVFSHLPADYQFEWLGELRRVTRPGGLALLTVHGAHAAETHGLGAARLERLGRDGFLYVPSWRLRGVLPSYYQTAYHTREYVLAHWGRYFRVLAILPRRLAGLQDLVVLERPSAG
jgi:SAM-dependent methyltransferase